MLLHNSYSSDDPLAELHRNNGVFRRILENALLLLVDIFEFPFVHGSLLHFQAFGLEEFCSWVA